VIAQQPIDRAVEPTHVMGVARFERFFRAVAGLDVDKEDLKRYSGFVNHKVYDLLIRGEATAKANGRDLIEPIDLPIAKGLQENMQLFKELDETIELKPILDHLTAGPARSLLQRGDLDPASRHRGWTERGGWREPSRSSTLISKIRKPSTGRVPSRSSTCWCSSLRLRPDRSRRTSGGSGLRPFPDFFPISGGKKKIRKIDGRHGRIGGAAAVLGCAKSAREIASSTRSFSGQPTQAGGDHEIRRRN